MKNQNKKCIWERLTNKEIMDKMYVHKVDYDLHKDEIYKASCNSNYL